MRSRSVATSEMKSAKKPTKYENNAAEKHGCRFVYINRLRVQSTLFRCAATLDDPKNHYSQTNSYVQSNRITKWIRCAEAPNSRHASLLFRREILARFNRRRCSQSMNRCKVSNSGLHHRCNALLFLAIFARNLV